MGRCESGNSAFRTDTGQDTQETQTERGWQKGNSRRGTAALGRKAGRSFSTGASEEGGGKLGQEARAGEEGYEGRRDDYTGSDRVSAA